MSYLLHVALMQALALFAYRLLLDREPLGHPKRGYLLLGLLLPFAIPYWTVHWVELPAIELPAASALAPNGEVPDSTPAASPPYLVWLYGSGVVLMVLRFCYSLGVLIRQLVRGTVTHRDRGAYWVSVPGLRALHSFGPWIFYPPGDLPSRAVALHELAHVRQWHTLDRLLVAGLRVAWWFNPLIYAYERAIVRNHELLADRYALLHSGGNVTAYRRELLAALTPYRHPALASGLSFTSTKHRFVMLGTSASSRPRLLLKGIFLCALWGGLLFSFGATGYAQSEASVSTESAPAPPPPPVPGWADPTRWEELDNDERARRALAIHLADKGRTIEPSELAAWTDGDVYGVWLDGRRVDNATLRSLSPADLYGARISKLLPNAVNYDDHRYQVDLTTKAAYDAKLEELRARAPGC